MAIALSPYFILSYTSVDKFLSHSSKKLRRGSSLCFTEFLVSKKFMEKEGGPRFPVEYFLSHIAEKICRGTQYCFTIFGYRQILCFRGLCHGFLSKITCLTVPKNFVGEPFCAAFQKTSGFTEIYGEEGVGYQVLPSKSFCLTVPKKYIGEPIRVSLFLGIDKFYASEG